jgi:preprotein translocase subunit SecF
LIYIAFRFEFRFAVGAVLALVHDVIITVGIYTMAGREFTLQTLAVVLTIVGYSINDTIVVYDRIRENMRKNPKSLLEDNINLSINETLSRTILTSLTVMLVVLALFFLGGEIINDFAFALVIGLISGSYSTIFIASPIVIFWKGKKPIHMRG